jgi:hypothetical protein
MNLSRRTWVLSLAVAVLAVLFVFSFFHKEFNGDEGIIGEYAYWLDKIGYVKSQMFDGMGMGWEKQLHHYHKFFVLTGSWVIHLFGLSLFALRSVSLVFFLLFLYFLRRYTRKRSDTFDRNDFMIFVIVLLLNSTLFDFAFVYRPEVMIMSLGFISFYLLHKGLTENRTALIYASAALAGMCAFTHLNGLIFIFAGAVVLLFHRKYILCFTYGFVGGLVSLLYFFDLTTASAFQRFMHQFANDPNLGKQHFKLYTPLLKILNDHMRFFHSPKEIVFSVLFFFSLIWQFPALKSSHRPMLIYLFALIIGLAGISHGPTPYYALVYYPYVAIIITLAIKRLWGSPKLLRTAFIVALAAYGLVNAYYISHLLTNAVDVESESEALSQELPQKNVKVIAGEFFFFNQVHHYRICIPLTYEILCRHYHREDFTKEGFFRFAQENDNEYIILSKKLTSQAILEMIGYDALVPKQKIFNYSVLKKGPEHVIFQRDPR